MPISRSAAALVAAGAVAAVGLGAGLYVSWPTSDNTPKSPAVQTPPASEVSVTVTTLAGSGSTAVAAGGKVDGSANSAQFKDPSGIATDGKGNLYIADSGNNIIRRVSASGDVSTLAGSGQPGLADGPALQAQFFGPTAVAVASDGTIVVADTGNHRIRAISPAGQVSTIAGSGEPGLGRGGFADGPAGTARFNLPKGVAVDPSGNIYVADTDNLRVRRIAAGGIVTTFAGNGEQGLLDGPAGTAQFSNLAQISFDSSGRLWVADQVNGAIRLIDRLGNVSTIVKTGLHFPASVATRADGSFLVADTGAHTLRLYDSSGLLLKVIGSGVQGYRDGTANDAQFSNPVGIVVLVFGSVIVTDSGSHRVRSVALK